jgi:hypothetical protein
LTNRKKPKGCWENFFYCFYQDDDVEYDPHAVVEVNSKLIDMLIFSEHHWLYEVFCMIVIVNYLISSYLYLFIAANRYTMTMSLQDHLNVVYYIESIFLLHIVIQFFKEFTPEGGGDRSKPVREWTLII